MQKSGYLETTRLILCPYLSGNISVFFGTFLVIFFGTHKRIWNARCFIRIWFNGKYTWKNTGGNINFLRIRNCYKVTWHTCSWRKRDNGSRTTATARTFKIIFFLSIYVLKKWHPTLALSRDWPPSKTSWGTAQGPGVDQTRGDRVDTWTSCGGSHPGIPWAGLGRPSTIARYRHRMRPWRAPVASPITMTEGHFQKN